MQTCEGDKRKQNNGELVTFELYCLGLRFNLKSYWDMFFLNMQYASSRRLRLQARCFEQDIFA